MHAAVILLWAGCLWSICWGILCLLLTATPWKRLALLAVLLLARSCCHTPEQKGEN